VICSKCREDKSRLPSHLPGLEGLVCDNCRLKWRFENEPGFRARYLRKATANGVKYQKSHPEKTKSFQKRYRDSHTTQGLLRRAAYRAKQQGLSFSLEEGDIPIPERCPVLGVPIKVGQGRGRVASANAPSLDRVNNNEGYTKENTRVISSRANSLKSDGSLEEFRAIVKYMEGELLKELSALGQEQEAAERAHEEKTGERLLFDNETGRWTWRMKP